MLLSVFTVAIYTIFLTKQFPSNAHLFFSLQLHDASTLFSMLISVIFLLWFFIICSMFLVQLWLNLTLFRLKILFNLCSLRQCLSNKFRNTRHMLVDTLFLYGGLCQMMLRMRFLGGLLSLMLLS